MSREPPPAGYRGHEVGLHELLAARERRAARQVATVAQHGVPVVSLTVVMPGPVKDNAWSRRALREAMASFDMLCDEQDWQVLAREQRCSRSGPEALFAVDADAVTLKSSTIGLENTHPIGRLWDFDVIGLQMSALGRKMLGFSARRCLVCDHPARECGRSRGHSLDLLLSAIGNMMVGRHASAAG